jgi:hypothetical protein
MVDSASCTRVISQTHCQIDSGMLQTELTQHSRPYDLLSRVAVASPAPETLAVFVDRRVRLSLRRRVKPCQ